MPEGKHFYEFGPFRLDPAERLLLRNNQTIPLAPKAFETIKTLDDECAEIYRRHPYYKPPDLRQVLRQLIQSPT